jgi:hypothetical protein
MARVGECSVAKGTRDEIGGCIQDLLQIVQLLGTVYPKKSFTLDGRLVGDIGEALVEPHHDARTADGKLVQIKATMKDALSFPIDHVPDYYLGVRIRSNGSIEEIFNGPGSMVAELLAKRVPTKNGLHMLGICGLRKLNEEVPQEQKVARRGRQLDTTYRSCP